MPNIAVKVYRPRLTLPSNSYFIMECRAKYNTTIAKTKLATFIARVKKRGKVCISDFERCKLMHYWNLIEKLLTTWQNVGKV
jgi:hypothetical protein